MATSYLDLNTSNILQNWDVGKAIKELLANAIDESVETKTALPIVQFSNNTLIISDRGRGLDTIHFTQNINNTKAGNCNYIGKFGIGLKDCLAVLYSQEKRITIESRYLYVAKLVKRKKYGFENKVLHVVVEEPRDEDFIGTTITIDGITSKEHRNMKRHFPQFCFKDPPLVKTKYGCIYAKNSSKEESIIFINGIRVNEEDNFMYHYSIKSDNKKIMHSMSTDRDRNIIGKTIYGEKIQQIIKEASAKCQRVRSDLLYQFNEDSDDRCYELSYSDIKKLKESIVRRPKIKVIVEDSSSSDEIIKPKVKVVVKPKNKVTITSSEDETIPPTPIRITKEQQIFLKEGHNMLSKLFGTSIPVLKVKITNYDESNSDVIYIKAKHFKSLKSFLCRLLYQCMHLSIGNKNKEMQICASLVEVSSRLK